MFNRVLNMPVFHVEGSFESPNCIAVSVRSLGLSSRLYNFYFHMTLKKSILFFLNLFLQHKIFKSLETALKYNLSEVFYLSIWSWHLERHIHQSVGHLKLFTCWSLNTLYSHLLSVIWDYEDFFLKIPWF